MEEIKVAGSGIASSDNYGIDIRIEIGPFVIRRRYQKRQAAWGKTILEVAKEGPLTEEDKAHWGDALLAVSAVQEDPVTVWGDLLRA